MHEWIACSEKHRQNCQQRQTAPSPYLLRTKSIFGPKSPQDRPPHRRSLVTIVGSRGSDSTWGTHERDSSRSATSLAGAGRFGARPVRQLPARGGGREGARRGRGRWGEEWSRTG